MTSLVSLLLQRAADHPSRTALIEASGQSLSYGELAEQSARMAAYLQQRGIGPGDRILVAVWPGIALYKSLAALWRIGAIAVFPEAAQGLTGLRHAAATLSPKAMIAGFSLRWLRPLMPELRAIKQMINPHDPLHDPLHGKSDCQNDYLFEEDLSCASAPALISFTSGTTGTPKAMSRSHALLLAQHQALGDVLADQQMQTDLVAFPAVGLSCLGYGHCVVLPRWNLRRHDRAKAKILWQQIEQQKVTRLIAPPVIVETLLRSQPACSHESCFRQIITGGGPFYPDLMQDFTRIFPDKTFHILYGSTEAEPISHLNIAHLTDHDWKAACHGGGLPVGRISPYTTLRLDENGEIQVAGAHVNEGYLDKNHNKMSKILHNGRLYHRTGDIGRLDSQGNLWLLGRIGLCPPLPSSHTSPSHSPPDHLPLPYPFVLEVMQMGISAAAAIWLEGRMFLAITGMMPASDSDFCQFLTKNNITLVLVKSIPRERRHRSKTDYHKLKKILLKKIKNRSDFKKV